MKTSMTILFKFITTFLAAWISFELIDKNPTNIILIIAIVGTVLKYILGDLFIFSALGNTLASIVDGVIAAIIAYVFDIFTDNFSTSSTGLIIFAAIIAAAEYIFHLYLMKDETETRNEFHQEPPIE
ncbi:MAG: hypothetical protein K0R07_1451 [Sedimentibacter sp.]|nr:hypothetical protein [Sedimentibacter sp.]